MSRIHDLPFDQFQRYKLVSLLVEQLREKGESLSILDVGGRTALLRGFLKRDHVTLVDLEPSSEKGLVLGDGAALPFRDQSFDLVCAFDTLEHVPPPQRARFVRECARVARRWVVLAGPYQSEEVEEAEKLLQKFLRDKLGVRHRYLEEHRHHGLPEREATEGQLEKLGARVMSLGHGNVQRWLALISLSMYMDHTPALQAVAVRLHRFYNHAQFGDDFEAPVYRHAVVAALGTARLPKPPPVRAQARPPSRELLHFAQELAAFDAHRDGYQAEFERLKAELRAVEADLAGHRRSLAEALERRAEAQRVARDLGSDLEGHKRSLREESARRAEAEAVIATLRADLEGHRQSLLETRAQREEAAAVIATLETDLAGHRASLEELRTGRELSEDVIAGLQREVESHRGSLLELSQGIARYEGLIAEHRLVIGERERELERHGQVLAELRVQLSALDAEQAKVLDLRESERREFEAVRSKLQGEIGALQGARGELERELSSREKHAAEVQLLLAREQAAFEAELQRLERTRQESERAWQAERKAFEGVIAAREADLARHAELESRQRTELVQERAVREARERELEQHRVVVADQRMVLEQRAGELTEAQARELRLQAELANARDQLADLRGALDRAAGTLEEKQRLIDLMRTELKSRLRSLRRALGPARATPGE